MLKRSITAWLLVAVMLLSAVLAAVRPGAALAAPEPRITPLAVAHQTLPDWMPPETAAQLDVGIDVLVPLSIPFVAALFLWKRGFTLYDHGVFVLYSLTFMSALLTLVVTSIRFDFLAGWVITAAVFAVPAHMFFQLKGAYSLRTFSALWRTFFLLIFCFITLLLFAIAIFAMIA